MEVGDHLVTARTGYTHHGIFIGDDRVIHYSGLSDGLKAGSVEIVALAEFGAGRAVTVRHEPLRVYSGKAAVDRAMLRMGEDSYNVLINNCEHFVNHCIFGVNLSTQVLSVAGGLASSLKGSGGVGFGAGIAGTLFSQGIKGAAPTLKEKLDINVSPATSIGVETGIKVAALAAATVVAAPIALPAAALAALWKAATR